MSRIRVLAALLAASLLLVVPTAHATTSSVVVSQVYASGGNSGASFANDYVELFNRGSSSVDVTGWTVQYATAAGTSWSATALSGSIAPGHYYLVQLASAAAVGSALPAPDATGTTNLAASGGKIALVHDATALTCGATAGSCSAIGAVEDLLGYGSASDYEGAGAASSLSAATAATRAGAGCTNTDVNSADFANASPAPRNSASTSVSCSSAPPPSSVSQPAAVEIDIQPVLSISLERPTVSFGNAVAGDTPAAISERVTVISNNATGYALTVHRSAFTPADLPLGLSSTAPSGTQLAAALAGGAVVSIPIAPVADLTIGTSSARSAGAGDAWPTSLGFTTPLPVVSPGHYAATVTYTVIGR